jgi:hypothetical protein
MPTFQKHVRLFSFGLVISVFSIPLHAAQDAAADPPAVQLEPKALDVLKGMSARLAGTQGMSFKAVTT